MTSDNLERHESREAPAVKKPYKPPSFRFERVFAVAALSCGKVFSDQLSCHLNPKAS